MRARHLLLFVLVLISSGPLVAQSSTPAFNVWTGAGIELLGARDNTTLTPGRVLQLGFSLQPANQALGVRLSGWFLDRQRTFGDLRQSRLQTGGFGVDATYELSRGRTRPYLLAGAGVSWLYSASSTPNPLGFEATGSLRTTLVNDGQSLYGAVGVGLQRQLLGVRLFSEVRYTRFAQSNGVAPHVAPLTFGVRF